jgi:CRISPR/Cas system CSM-associated protein Csm2 small subunit
VCRGVYCIGFNDGDIKMNERIKKLLEQAYDQAVPETWTNLSSEQLERIYDKFAELIVKECLDACSRANEIRYFVPPTQEQVVLSCMREIEETFRS